MYEADPTESAGELQTIDVSSTLFLSSKRTQAEQLTRGQYVGGGRFARPDQNRFSSPDSDYGFWDLGEGADLRSRGSATSEDEDADEDDDSQSSENIENSEDTEDSEAQAAKAERRRKGKQARSGSVPKLRAIVVPET